MGPIGGWLVARFGSNHDGTRRQKRAAYGLLEGYVSIAVNLVLAAVKLALGVVTGSIGIVADAVHTLSDSLTSVVVIFSAYVARKPADVEHPFGHGRAEPIGTMIIAVLLGVAGFEFAKTGVERLMSPVAVSASWWVIVALVGTIVGKEWLSRFALVLAKESGNKALEADFWHHRSDAISTVLVVVGVVGGHYGFPQLDALAGIGVAGFLFWVAFSVASDAIHPLVGEAPSHEEVQGVKDAAMRVPGVRGVHDVVIHRYGEVRFVSLHIETSDSLSALELHELTHKVEAQVAGGDHGSVCVHPDPVNDHHPAYAQTHSLVTALIAEDEDLDSFHDLRIVGWGDVFNVVVDVKTTPDTDDAEAALGRLEEGIRRRFPKASLVAEVEPPYSY